MMLRSALILILLIATPISHAQNAKRYRFEIIIFEYTNPQYAENESWPKGPGTPEYQNTLFTITGNAPKQRKPAIRSSKNRDVSFFPLSSSDLILKKEAKAVKRSSRRKLMLHTAWIQSMHANKYAYPVAIKMGKQFSTLIPDPANDSLSFRNDLGSNNDATNFSDSQFTPDNQTSLIPVKLKQLEGTIKISIGRYLHVWTDLVYRRPTNNPALIDNNSRYTDLNTYRHQDHRRMRSKELHYIDNPNFGILIYALPVKPAPSKS